MKSNNLKFATLLMCISFSFVTVVNAQKITVEEVIAKHLDSIAIKEKRAEIKNQLIFATVNFKQKGSTTQISGKGLILSAGEKNLWGMNLSSNDYPQDQFSYNGKDTQVGFTKPGLRSVIGSFIQSYTDLLKEGLLGGSLTSSWALLRTDSSKAKMTYDGTKKIDETETHVISFSPKNGSDLNIKMYFDKKTFYHLRTEYSRVIAATQGSSIDNSAGRTPDRYKLIEDFSGHTKMGSLTLPASYRLLYNFSRTATVRESEWQFNVTNYSFNQALDANSFEVITK